MDSPIIQAVQRAAHLCRVVQQRHIVPSEKPGREPVTIADYGSQAILGRAISLAYPDDAILAEEKAAHFVESVAETQRQQAIALVSEAIREPVTESDFIHWLEYGRNKKSDRVWAIDPIDGTMGFMALRRYTIAVGLLIDQQPVESVMGCPRYPDEGGLGRLFYTDRGSAFMMAMDGSRVQQIHVSSHTSGDRIIAVESFESSHADHSLIAHLYDSMALQSVQIERLDGQDKYCMVACGDADLYLRVSPDKEYQHKTWDHAAGIALVRAAGGLVTDQNNLPIEFSPDGALKNQFIITSNGHIHQNALHGVNQVLS